MNAFDSDRRWRPYFLAFLGAVLFAGTGLRAYHYLRDPSMWGDEAALVLNVLDRDYLDLLGHLRFHEAAPPLFLWLERAAAQFVGDNTYSLRLVPFIASILLLAFALPAFVRWLGVSGALLALALLAFSDRLLWHACEAKPYALDALVALLAPAIYFATRSWRLERRIALQAVLAPLWIWLVYPGAFIVGGVMAALGAEVYRRRTAALAMAYAGGAIVVVLAFLALALGPAAAQRTESMDSCWTNYFPDWSRPLSVPAWGVIGIAQVIDYCFRPLGGLLIPAFILGGVHLSRRRRDLFIALVVPILLAFVAALVGKYPFGGARVMVFASVPLSVLAGEAGRALIVWFAEARPLDLRALTWGRVIHIGTAAALVVSLLATGSLSAARPFWDWRRSDSAGAINYARERGADLPIVGNQWEYEYYLHDVPHQLHALTTAADVPADRFWLVVSSPRSAERDSLQKMFDPAIWEVHDAREFSQTSVRLLQRRIIDVRAGKAAVVGHDGAVSQAKPSPLSPRRAALLR